MRTLLAKAIGLTEIRLRWTVICHRNGCDDSGVGHSEMEADITMRVARVMERVQSFVSVQMSSKIAASSRSRL